MQFCIVITLAALSASLFALMLECDGTHIKEIVHFFIYFYNTPTMKVFCYKTANLIFQ